MTPAPDIVIIGRPNVGKSLLFNRLIGKRQSLVHKTPGMTLDTLRERLDGGGGKSAWLVDTGGMAGEEDDWTAIAREQMEQASAAAGLFLLVVDAKHGLAGGDSELARQLRRRWQAPWFLVVNKAEGMDTAAANADFLSLGATRIFTVSAKHGDGLTTLSEALADWTPAAESTDTADSTETAAALPVAIVGRPNVGKSTFVNRLLGATRMAVSDRPGTTRDAVSSELPHPDGALLLVDTAGMKRARATAEREKIAVAAARRAVAAAAVAVFMFDLNEGITHQDKRIAALIEDAGCALIFLANKADLLPAKERPAAFQRALAALALSAPAEHFLISATGKRSLPTAKIFRAVRHAAAAAQRELPTAGLNAALAKFITHQAPRRVGSVRPKLRYAHQGGTRPLRIIIHGNAVKRIDDSYRRYLAAAFAREFSIVGAPIKIILRQSDNPYI